MASSTGVGDPDDQPRRAPVTIPELGIPREVFETVAPNRSGDGVRLSAVEDMILRAYAVESMLSTL